MVLSKLKHWMDTLINVTTFCGFSPILSFGRTTRAALEEGSRSDTPELSSPSLNSPPKAREPPSLLHWHTDATHTERWICFPNDQIWITLRWLHTCTHRAPKRKGQTPSRRQSHLSDRSSNCSLQVHITRGGQGRPAGGPSAL